MTDASSGVPVAVIGAGFSGTMTAVHLARHGLQVLLFEAGLPVGKGIAYGTKDPNHFLNVPAARMSPWPDQPDYFQDWLQAEPGSFATRFDFGRCVADILDREEDVRVEQVRVVGLRSDGQGWKVETEDGRTFASPAVVLALGNEPPQAPAGWEEVAIIDDPWSTEAQASIAHAAEGDWPLLLIGTGLTMADVMLSLNARGYRGRAVAVSRRGILPHAHAPSQAVPVNLADVPAGNLLALFRWLRRRSEDHGFRAAVDSLRPHGAALWQALPMADRRRFLRHGRPWWDVHRHRLAPHVADRLQEMIVAGRLEVKAGRFLSADGDELVFRGPHGSHFVERPRLVINCTGPLGSIGRTRNPLLRQLLEDEIVSVDPLGISLDVSDDQAAPRLWAMGPLTKGSYWEITAVPEIRVQASRVAAAIAKAVGATPSK